MKTESSETKLHIKIKYQLLYYNVGIYTGTKTNKNMNIVFFFFLFIYIYFA